MGRGKLGHYKNVTPAFAWCFMGGPGAHMAQLGISDYAWPRVLWEMALDRKGRGEYAYVALGSNEAAWAQNRRAATVTVN